MAANRTDHLQNLVLMWRLHDYSCYSYATPLHLAPQPLHTVHAASVKMILGAVIPTWSPGGEEWSDRLDRKRKSYTDRVQFSS